MSELKTLKDIEDYWEVYQENNPSLEQTPLDICDIVFEDLRKEAMKWIKYYRVNHRQGNLPCEALILFLNITEEDLK